MVTIIKIPRYIALLKKYSSKPTITKWLRADGESVEAHEALLVVETNKTTLEIEAPATGWVFHLKSAREKVNIGDAVGVIAGGKEEFESYKVGLPHQKTD